MGPDRVLVTVDSPGTPNIIWPCTTRPAGSSSPATPSGSASPTPGCCARRRRRRTSTSIRPSTRWAVSPQRRPAGLALAHYGLLAESAAILDEADETLRRWAEVAEKAWRDGGTSPPPWTPPSRRLGGRSAHREKLETLNGVHSNAAGFRRWLETRAQATPPPTSPCRAPRHRSTRSSPRWTHRGTRWWRDCSPSPSWPRTP